MRRKSPRLGRRGRTYALLCTTTHSEATARGSALRSSGLIPGEVPAVMSDHRQGIKIELLRADVAFWKSPDTPDAHHTAMRLAFEGVAMVLFAAGPDGCRGCETSGDRTPPHRRRLATIHGRCPSSQADRCKFPGNGSQYPLRARRTVRH